MKLTLSFDNGPDAAITPRLVDVLARHHVRAHFFVLGKHIAHSEGRALVTRMLVEGHCVANHSYTHTVPLGDDPRPEAVEEEIGQTDALLSALNVGPRMFRPFGGGGLIGAHLLSPRAIAYLCEHAFTCVLWNSVPRDWEEPERWPDIALADVATRPHTLLVLHDIEGACLARLEDFLITARDRGHEFVLEFPSECIPIREGKIVSDVSRLVRGP